MKASHVVIVSALLGAALGVGVAWGHFGDSPPLLVENNSDSLASTPKSGQPKVLIDAVQHDFGTVERDRVVRHAFQFTNLGSATLHLKRGSTTCSRCTIAELTKSEVAPGETVDVIVQYEASRNKPIFRQIAVILTDDPEQPRVELTINGLVSSRYEIEPAAVIFSKVSATSETVGETTIYGYLCDEIRLVKYSLANEETAANFEASTEPIPKDKLVDPKARCGTRLIVKTKPGLPLGPIRQTIRLTLGMEPSGELIETELPFEGQVEADISVVGPNWNSQYARLSIGSVKNSQGAKRQLLLILRGAHRHDVTIKPAKIDPEWVHVTLGTPTDIRGGATGDGVTQIPLTIEIPPGVGPSNHLGTSQGEYGHIVLETTDPQVPQIPINLMFVVEN
jgi:hypothetical protein